MKDKVSGRVRLVITGWIVGCLILAMPGAAVASDPVPQNDAVNAMMQVSNAVEYQGNTIGAYALQTAVVYS
jgi:hypothetical protein